MESRVSRRDRVIRGRHNRRIQSKLSISDGR
jgi:hypothetical protein